jgi:glycosyltransferase involved in cell wall biosynthesis
VAEPGRRGGSKTVIAFFGQITPFKGVDVLLEAYGLLPDEVQDEVDVRVYGENKHWLGGDFDRRMRALSSAVKGGVRMLGAYRNEDVAKLMRGCDWVVVPSIWWENSPVVIQEAKLAGCGIICSDIGGMAEKTDESIDVRFPAGNAPALAGVIEEIVIGQGRGLDARIARAAEVEAARGKSLEAHMRVYESLIRAGPKGKRRSGGSLVRPGQSVPC